MRPKGKKSGHRRQYLPNSNVTHYDLLKWQSGARKLAAFQSTQIVKLVRAAKTSMSGTDSHVRVQEQFRAFTSQLGFIHRWKLRAEVKGARVLSWITNRDVENYREFKAAA